MSTFALYSDLHLEFRKEHYITSLVENMRKNNTDYLVLAGDICPVLHPNLEIFLSLITKGSWKKVFYVPGNHEFYCKERNVFEILLEIEKICKDNNIQLVNTPYEASDFVLFGCTLWSNINDNACEKMNDFHKIHGRNGLLTQKEYLNLHYKDKSFLKSRLEKYEKDPRKKIVVTHHLPTYKAIHAKYCIERYSSYNSGFASSLDNLLDYANFWFFGHSHISMDFIHRNCRLVSNPLGYINEESDFEIDKVIKILP